MASNELIPTADVAARFGVDVRTIHRLVAAGRLVPATKAPGLRGAYLFTPAEVERCAAAEQEMAS